MPARVIFNLQTPLNSPPLIPKLTNSRDGDHCAVGRHFSVGAENDQAGEQNTKARQAGEDHLRLQRALDGGFAPDQTAEQRHHHTQSDGGQGEIDDVV
jgi:hypothetical protein